MSNGKVCTADTTSEEECVKAYKKRSHQSCAIRRGCQLWKIKNV